MTVTDEDLGRLFAERDRARLGRVEHVLRGLNPRERKLIVEAAVMGHVRGAMAGRVAGRDGQEPEIPNSRDLLVEVVSCCLGMSDLYPQMSRAEQRGYRRSVMADEGA